MVQARPKRAPAPRDPSRLQALREARGLSQAALADAVGLSRQSVNAIETGRSTPSVDVALRLARALDSTVEDLFAAPSHELEAEPAVEGTSGRVTVARVGGRWVAYPLSGWLPRSADGVVRGVRRRKLDVELLRPEVECRENVIVMGCALALGLIADRLNARRDSGRFVWIPASSGAALGALAARRTHLAGVHLVDSETGEANVPDVRRQVRGRALELVTLARWEAGYVVSKGNPRSIRSREHLGRRGTRIAVREQGSGARRLLDDELHQAGLSLDDGHLATTPAMSHLEVAHAVSIGAAHVGLATRDAALAFDLDFVPVVEERYDLALPVDASNDARLSRFFDALTSAAVRRELTSLGYDVRSAGERIARIPSA